jgi:galactokinase
MKTGDARMVGKQMNSSHASLRDDFEVTNDELDIMAKIAQVQPGCFGARMTGGGFGGCAIALVEEGSAEEMASAISSQYEVATSLKPNIFLTSATNGVALIP